MILKALEIQGFKSFPDKTKLVFDRGLTAVVGPNGSGKSNVSDAVRWVLGDQSTKTLRASKMSDVIFNGTEQRPAKGYAQVKLFIEDKDNSLGLNKKDICVSRTYYRSGESEYRINEDKVKLRQVYELFFDTGIGKNGYSIISQGKIENLVSSAGKDRREIFDEAVGISQLRFKKNEATKKIQAAEENLVRLKDIYSEIKDRYLPLKRQKEKAEAYLVYAKDLREYDVSLRLTLMSQIESQIEEIEEKLKINELDYESVNLKLAESENKIENLINENQETAMAVEALKNEIVKLNEEKSDFNSNLAVTENNTENANREIIRLEKEIEILSLSDEDIKNQIEELSCKVNELDIMKNKKYKEHDKIGKELETLNNLKKEKADETFSLNNQIDLNLATLSKLSLETSTKEIYKNQLNEEIKQDEIKINQLDESKEKLLKETESEKKAYDEAKRKSIGIKNILSGHEIRKNKQQQKIDSLKDKIEDSKNSILKLKNDLMMQRTYQNNLGGHSKTATSFANAVKSGLVAGVEGALSENIKTKSEFSLAIETALGASIQNFITDNNVSAKKAVKYLKENNMGRLTFLPVDTIKPKTLTDRHLLSCDGVIGIASDLVESSDRHRNITSFLLGRVVVVDNMENGFKLAKKYNNRFRIVTLDGQIIGVGGSVTGGSKVRTSGILSIKDRIAKLESNIKKEERNLQNIIEEYKKESSAYAKIIADFEGATGDLQRINQVFLILEERLKTLSERTSEKEIEIKSLQENMQSAEEKIKTVEAEIIKIKEQTEEIEATNEELKAKLSQTAESENNDEREELTKKLTEYEKEIIGLEKEIENKNYLLESLNSSAENSKQKLSKLYENKEQILSQIEKFNSYKEELKQKILNTDEKILSDNNEIETILSKSSDFEKNITSHRIEQKSQMEEREKITGELARLREKLSNEKENYEEMNSNLFEEYNLTVAGAMKEAKKIDNISAAQLQISLIKGKIKKLGNINVAAIEEFKELEERYKEYTKQIEDIEKAKTKLLKLSRDLTKTMTHRFKTEFEKINKAFQKVFAELFSGGHAKLEIEDEEDILESNINISVQPPGKNVQSISLLSGGEKGFAAICLLFAILKVSPAPFCIFDEVEAALDDVNVSKFASYVRKMSDETQFILITHRRGTMEESDRLYGVTMEEEGVSKLLLMDLKEIEKRINI